MRVVGGGWSDLICTMHKSAWPAGLAPGRKFSIFVAVLTLRELGDGKVT